PHLYTKVASTARRIFGHQWKRLLQQNLHEQDEGAALNYFCLWKQSGLNTGAALWSVDDPKRSLPAKICCAAQRPPRCGSLRYPLPPEGYVRRRGTVSRKSAKAQHHKPTRLKRGNALTTARRGSSSQLADLQERLKRQERELEEAREEWRQLQKSCASF